MSKIHKDKHDWIGFKINNNVVIDKIGETKTGRAINDILIVQCLICDDNRQILASSFISNESISCRRCSNRNIPLGKVNGQLTVIDYEYRRYKNGRSVTYYICKCSCGNNHTVKADIFNYKECHSCKDCQGFNKGFSRNIDIRRYFSRLKGNAKKRKLEFNITQSDIEKLLKEQNNKCSLSKMNISLSNGTASLDRINSNLGYIPNNIQWVHRNINYMKYTFSQEEFIKLCSLVYINS